MIESDAAALRKTNMPVLQPKQKITNPLSKIERTDVLVSQVVEISDDSITVDLGEKIGRRNLLKSTPANCYLFEDPPHIGAILHVAVLNIDYKNNSLELIAGFSVLSFLDNLYKDGKNPTSNTFDGRVTEMEDKGCIVEIDHKWHGWLTFRQLALGTTSTQVGDTVRVVPTGRISKGNRITLQLPPQQTSP